MERKRAKPQIATMRRSKSLLFDFMHIGALIEEPKTQQERRRKSISSMIREHRDFIDDYDYVYEFNVFDNLDKWKSARRQRVPERLLSRAEEAKRLLEEEEARQIRKVKTFSEMMQQRQSRQQSTSHLGYNLNFFSQEHVTTQGEDCVHFDEENKENGLGGHKRLTTADSVDSQSEGKSSDGVSDERLGSEGSHGSEERLVSPLDQWTADSGVDSLSGSAVGGVSFSDMKNHPRSNDTGSPATMETPLKDSVLAQPRPASALPGPSPPKEASKSSNPNEVIIRLFINPSSDIFGFTLTQNGHKVIVESVDEDGVADLAGLKKGDEVISLNGVLADSPGSVPSSMDLALMTGQLEMIIYRADAQNEESAEEVERRTNFKMKLARFCAAELGTSNNPSDAADGDKTPANEVIIEPKLVERRKSQLFIQALQLEQDEERDPAEQNDREHTRPTAIDVPVEEQLVIKRKNSLSKSLAETAIEKKSPVEEIAPQTIEKKKAEFIRQASSENIVRSIDLKSDIVIEQHLVLQRKASIEKAAQRCDESRIVDLPSVAVAQIKASIENGNATGSANDSAQMTRSKTPSVDVETTLEERKASFFEHSGTRVERTTVDLNIEPKLIEQRKANFLENAEAVPKTERNLELEIQPKLIEQRKANFLENATKKEKPVQEIEIEAKIVERKLMALQIGSETVPAPFSSDQRKVELTVNSMQSKPKIEVPIEPDLIRKRKEALFCSSSTTNDIERRRAKLANIEAEVYGTSLRDEQPTPPVTVSLPISAEMKRTEGPFASNASVSIHSLRSPTDRSESTISEESRSCGTTVTEIKREVDTTTMLSSVASSSMFSSISERNESPAHLSDLSPDSETAPISGSNIAENTVSSPEAGFENVRHEERNTFEGSTPEMAAPSLHVNEASSHLDVQSPINDRLGGHFTEEVIPSPNTEAAHRMKDAGHTPWNREQQKDGRERFVLQSTSTTAIGDPKVAGAMKHHTNLPGYLQQAPAEGGKDLASDYPVTICHVEQRHDSERDRRLRQPSLMQPQGPRQQFHVEAEIRVRHSPAQELYGNGDILASGSGEQLYQVPCGGSGDFDLYDQLPSQPPKGIKKGPAPAPPTNMVPYNPAEELYENGPQFNRQQHMYHGPYQQQVGRAAAPAQVVQLATTVSTSQASLQGSQARFGPSRVEQDQMYGDVRRSTAHEAPVYGEMVRRREHPTIRQERKSYHEGAVNYPAYDFIQQTATQPPSASGYPCTEDIYENTRKYAKSCEDIYANSNQLTQSGMSSSLLLGGKTGQLPLTGGSGGYGQEIYENVETYAKTRDYLNNLRKPSVAEDLYEAPRVPHEQGRILSASVNKPTLDALQRSRSQPYMGGLGAAAETKLIPQRKSADSLRDDQPRQLTAELGTKKKAQQSNKPFNANHWLIQEAEMRRELDAQNLVYATQTSSQMTGPVYTDAPSGSVSQVNSHATNHVVTTTTTAPVSQMVQGPSSKRVDRVNLNKMPTAMEEGSVPGVGCSPTMPALSGPQRKAIVSQTSGPVPAANVLTPTDSSPAELGISGKKRCSLCSQELGRGAAMVIESLQLHFHLACFRCCVCRQRLGNGTCGTDVRVRNSKLHCHNCNSYDEAGLKYSRV